MMTEVFKTNIARENQARIIVNLIQQTFADYAATIDLEDCDKVLCVKSVSADICADRLIRLISDFGYHAEVMNDEIPTNASFSRNYMSIF